jgi:hypothetical protein
MDLNGHPLHAAMAPFSNKLIFLDGVDQDVAYDSIGDGHQTGMACILTNAEILPGTLFCEGNCDAGNEQYVGWGGGQSVDQYIADEIAKDVVTKFKSLELGVQVRSSSVWSRMSYSAPDQPVPPREDPNQNFTDFFSDIESDPFALRLRRTMPRFRIVWATTTSRSSTSTCSRSAIWSKGWRSRPTLARPAPRQS